MERIYLWTAIMGAKKGINFIFFFITNKRIANRRTFVFNLQKNGYLKRTNFYM